MEKKMTDPTRISFGAKEIEDSSLLACLRFKKIAGKSVEKRELHLKFGDQLIIGREQGIERASTIDVRIGDDRVSRKHAIIQLDINAVRLADLGSANGTTRNNNQVTETIILNNKDSICTGGAFEFCVNIIERDNQIKSVRLQKNEKSIILSLSEMIIGNYFKDCDIYIDDPILNHYHARLSYYSNYLFIEALNARNSVLVNDKPINQIELKDNDYIQIGNTAMVIKIKDNPDRTRVSR